MVCDNPCCNIPKYKEGFKLKHPRGPGERNLYFSPTGSGGYRFGEVAGVDASCRVP